MTNKISDLHKKVLSLMSELDLIQQCCYRVAVDNPSGEDNRYYASKLNDLCRKCYDGVNALDTALMFEIPDKDNDSFVVAINEAYEEI